MVEHDSMSVIPTVEVAIAWVLQMAKGDKKCPKGEGRLGQLSQRRVVQDVLWQRAGHVDGGEGRKGVRKQSAVEIWEIYS